MSDQSPTGPTAARKAATRKAPARKAAAPARKAAAPARKAAAPARKAAAPSRKSASPARSPAARTSPGQRASVAQSVAPSTVQVVEPARRSRLRIPREFLPPLRAFRLPGLGLHVPLPERDQLPWIAGVMIAAALDVIDWPVAVLVAVGHAVAAQSRNEAIRELAEGIETVA